MKKNDPLWTDLHNLLVFLESYGTIEELLRVHFAPYGNSAPPQLFRWYIDKLQKQLDEAPDE